MSSEYVICDMEGEPLFDQIDERLDRVVGWAKERLEDDPEMRELTVWQIDASGNATTHLRTITFGPDANWDSVVVVLKPGEHVQAPGPVPHRISEEDLGAYELGSPKRSAMEERLGDWI